MYHTYAFTQCCSQGRQASWLRASCALQTRSPLRTNDAGTDLLLGTRDDSKHHHLLEAVSENANVLELRQQLLHTASSGWWWCIEWVFQLTLPQGEQGGRPAKIFKDLDSLPICRTRGQGIHHVCLNNYCCSSWLCGVILFPISRCIPQIQNSGFLALPILRQQLTVCKEAYVMLELSLNSFKNRQSISSFRQHPGNVTKRASV